MTSESPAPEPSEAEVRPPPPPLIAPETPPLVSPNVWIGGNSRIARRIGRPVRRFIEVESAGGIVMLLATIAALIWANSPFQDTYLDFWETEVEIMVGNVEIFAHHSLVEFVNDVLMVFFFFVIGLEIKREIAVGQLSNSRNLMLPVMAALGGMIFPALTYVFFNLGDSGDLNGWGIPMATDIVFALGVVSLLGNRVPRSLKLFLLTFAVVDDIAAILVIAIFYTDNLSLNWLLAAIGVLVLVRAMTAARVWWLPAYILLGAIVWWAMFRSGVHPTIAGVAMGLLTPAKPLLPLKEAKSTAKWLEDKRDVFVVDIRWAYFNISESLSVAERLESKLLPFVTFGIVPIFVLANAGVIFSRDSLSSAATSPIAYGVAFGLIIGNTLGIPLFTWLGVKLKIANLPSGVGMTQIIGIALIAGIGFTVALFITALAFDPSQEAFVADAKIAILAASTLAAGLGMYVLSKTSPHRYKSETNPTS